MAVLFRYICVVPVLQSLDERMIVDGLVVWFYSSKFNCKMQKKKKKSCLSQDILLRFWATTAAIYHDIVAVSSQNHSNISCFNNM